MGSFVFRSAAWACALMIASLAAGCQDYLHKQGTAAGLQPKQPAPDEPAKTFTGTPQPAAQPEPIAPPADPNRTEEAREDVLAFINRLERLREAEADREPGADRQATLDNEDGATAGDERAASGPAAPQTRDVANLRPQHDRPGDKSRVGNATSSPPVRSPASPPVPKPKIVSVSIQPPEAVKLAGDREAESSALEEPLPNGRGSVRLLPDGRGSDLEPDAEQRIANRPMATEPEMTAEDEFKATYDAFTKEVAAKPNDVEARWRLALLAVGLGLWSNPALQTGEEPLPDGRGSVRPLPDGRGSVSSGAETHNQAIAESFAGMPQESARVLARSIDALAATRRAVDDPVEATDKALTAVNALRDALLPQAQLAVPAVAMCSRVQAFGVYDELSEGYLKPYTRSEAIVYFEVENFTWEQAEGGRYRSVIGDRFEVMDAGGEVLWQREEPSIEDLSRARREDFFVAQRITLPASLKEGDYVLKITVEDKLAGKATQAIHNFHVGLPTQTAARP